MNADVKDERSEKEKMADNAEKELELSVKDFYNAPGQSELLLFKLASLLFQFRSVPTPKLDDVIQEAGKKLFGHIKKYSLVSSDYSANKTNFVIEDIGYYGADLLCSSAPNYEYALTPTLKHQMDNSFFCFRKRWMNNVSRLVPHDLDLMQITPYLLTCYCANAKDNRIDPFTWYRVGVSDSELKELTEESRKAYQAVKDAVKRYTGWCDIFPEYWTDEVGNKSTSRQGSKVERYSTDKNVKRNIASLISYLTQIPSDDERLRLSSLVSTEGLDICWKIKSVDKSDLKEMQSKFSTQVKDWEVYRRFAAFCTACDEYKKQVKNAPKFNLTLSMALFARCWKCDLEEDFFDDNVELKEVSWEDIEADCLHDEIAEAVRYLSDSENGFLDIYDIVCRKKERLLEYYGLDSLEIALQIPENKQDDPTRPQPGEPLPT